MILKMDIQQQSPKISITGCSSAGIALSTPDFITTTPENFISANDLSLSPSSSNVISPNNSGSTRNSNVFGPVISDFLVPGRVITSGPILQGAMTVPIEPRLLAGKVDVQQISVNVTSFGSLDLDKKSKQVWTQDVHWVRAIRLSEDCHTYNVQLRLQPSYRVYPTVRNGPLPKLILQTVRPIEAGQELQLWFSEDILAMLQVVFLSPANIQGQKKYVCTRCFTLYESPNPLKLHITLACGKYHIFTLWERLASLMKETQTLRNVGSKEGNFDLKLTSEPQVCRQKNALDLTLAGHNNESKGLYRPYTECSAFKPFKKENAEIKENNAGIDSRVSEIPTIWPFTLETDVVQLHRSLMHNQGLANAQNMYNDDAQLESLVSSLGKAKQGHICLYCGKCYSRKYGLKIHIRTHTGYKPLRCKFCDRPFGDPSNLNKHVRLHAEGNTPYKCDLCGKILVRRRDLERHLKSRHMVEMHPGQNILPDLPVAGIKNSNSLIENSEPRDKNQNSPDYVENSMETKDVKPIIDVDQDVTVIDIQKELLLETNSSNLT